MKVSWFAGLLLVARLCAGAELSGEWVAQLSTFGDAQYSRAVLRADGAKIGGNWSDWKVEGSVSGNRVELALKLGDRKVGSLTGEVRAAELGGEGTVEMRGRGAGPGVTQRVTWKMTPAAKASRGPKTWDFEPKEFAHNYSGAIAPALRVFPGDTIRTWTVDSGGLDSKLDRRTSGGNPETGPFYIEGALPGDTLVVKLNRVRLNRDTARSGNRINGRSVTPAFVESAKYSPTFDSEWKLDREKGVATLAHPTERMKNYSVPILPMIGCVGTAPAGNQSFRTGDLGPFGGNLDYNQMGEGVTLYLPVSVPGALFFLGDGHAAMGDGELTGGALETSLDVEFTVDVVKGYVTAFPRLENADYIMSVGVAGSVPDAIQASTSQLAGWLKDDYHLNDNEIAVLLGSALKYDIAELVDAHFSVVAKVPKRALAPLK